ncbi:restriction endonuclease subunit S [Shimia sp. MMG029]|uniref:restriction endonuclease subunit S n=1 Tax=Shimia sp. MMG029 TaxID=3021978 RepID=UPI0022FDEAB7|nr:restriction endonuclease subunit S [Shimia sp. MMG029]MDA5557684.1 restriction endonuclease subunit S [Shimia sp. MMG029]
MNVERLLEVYGQISEAPDAIARLRRFVLDLAVRGKLVEQDAEDEPASELLVRIDRERKRLHSLSEIKKPKKLPPIDIAPFDLPSSWVWARMRDVTSDRGQEIPSAQFTYIDVSAIDKEAGVVSDPKVLERDEAPSRARKIARKGDVIYSCVRPYLLNVAVITEDFEPSPIASTAFAILNGYNLVLPWYLWIALRSPFMVECVERDQRGQAYPAINDKDFSLLPLPLPPLTEQHRIVDRVNELMALCDRLEEARVAREETRNKLTAASLTRLTAPETSTDEFPAHAQFALDALPSLTSRPDQIKSLRQTILNLAVRGKLVEQDPKDEPASVSLAKIAEARDADASRKSKRARGLPPASDTEASELPIGWAGVRLSDIAVSMRYGTSTKCGADTSLVPVLRIPNVSLGEVTLDDMKFGPLNEREQADLALAAGDLLMIRSNGSLDIVGRSAVVPIEADGMAFAGYLVRLRTDVKHVNTKYVWMAMNSQLIRDQIEKPIRSAVGLKNVNLTEFGNLSFWLPPLAEQHRIVAKVDALMTLCDRLEVALTTVGATRTRLLEALLHEALEPATGALEAAE